MKPQFQHKLATSYLLWFENFFMKKSEAYSVKTGIFTHFVDDRLPEIYESFGSEYKQMVYDSSLPNVYVPSGLYVNNNFVPFEKDKYMLDFDNGRFIASGISSGSSVSGQFTVKDINFYYTNDTEENIVLNVQEKINQSVSNVHASYYQPYEQKIPAIYVSNDSMKNKPFAFGGMNETLTKARATIIANKSKMKKSLQKKISPYFALIVFIIIFGIVPYNSNAQNTTPKQKPNFIFILIFMILPGNQKTHKKITSKRVCLQF